jgi:ribosomal protein L37AE/L43A
MEWNHPLKERAGGGKLVGFKVFRVRTPKRTREALAKLYRDVTTGRAHSKMLYYYLEEWKRAYEEVKSMREQAGKRTPPRPPPLFLLVRFITPDGEVRGNTAAPCVIDLRKGELRIPSYGIKIPLRPSLIQALIEENELEARPDFALQVTHSGKLRIIAQRSVRANLGLPLYIIAMDENSAYGFPVFVWHISGSGKAALCYRSRPRPPNHGYRRNSEAHLKSFADEPVPEKREALRGLANGFTDHLTPERARELAARTKAKERRLNNAFIADVVSKLRKLVRKAAQRGASVIVLVEPVDSETLRGTRLQGTLTRLRKRLRNMATYEGALFKAVRASGKQCPRCGRECREVERTKHSRIYECSSCRLAWDKDQGALFNMVLRYFARLRKEESDDETTLGETVVAAMKEWLEKHPEGLL